VKPASIGQRAARVDVERIEAVELGAVMVVIDASPFDELRKSQ
jgi:hypothetical protein